MTEHCKFVRRNHAGYEYGHIIIHNRGAKHEKREPVVVGHAPSYEAALQANTMAMAGLPKIRPHVEKSWVV